MDQDQWREYVLGVFDPTIMCESCLKDLKAMAPDLEYKEVPLREMFDLAAKYGTMRN